MIPVPKSDSRLTVLVADNVTMRCQLLADALQRTNAYEAVAASPAEVLPLLDKARSEKARFDVVLVGVSFFDKALENAVLIRQIQTAHPGTSTIILVDALDRTMVVETFRAGARGVFCRTDSFEALCKCIRCVHAGQVWASSQGLHFVLDAFVEHGPMVGLVPGARPLSNREEEISFLVAEGYSNKQISERLDLSEHTIKNYLFRVFDKLGVSTRVGLALYAIKHARPARAKRQSARPMPLPDAPLVLDTDSDLPS